MQKRQEAFVEAYINDPKRNQTAAAIAAGYSERNARQIAWRLMQDEEIKAAIDERLEEIKKQNTAERDEVIMFLTRIMRGEKDLDNVALLNGNGYQKMQKTEPNAKDRIKAAELLGKHYSLWDGKTAGNDKDSGVILMPEVMPEVVDDG